MLAVAATEVCARLGVRWPHCAIGIIITPASATYTVPVEMLLEMRDSPATTHTLKPLQSIVLERTRPPMVLSVEGNCCD